MEGQFRGRIPGHSFPHIGTFAPNVIRAVLPRCAGCDADIQVTNRLMIRTVDLCV